METAKVKDILYGIGILFVFFGTMTLLAMVLL